MATLPPQSLAGSAAANNTTAAAARVPASLRERRDSRSRSSSRPAKTSRGSSPVAASAGRGSGGPGGAASAAASASADATPAPAPVASNGNGAGVDAVLDEHQAIYPPPKSLADKAEVGSLEEYKRLWQKSINDPAAFWGDLAENEFFWSKKWDDVFTR